MKPGPVATVYDAMGDRPTAAPQGEQAALPTDELRGLLQEARVYVDDNNSNRTIADALLRRIDAALAASVPAQGEQMGRETGEKP